MKKVAIVSCYFQKNYGSVLQALATQELLEKNGINSVTIRFDGIEKIIKRRKYIYYIKNFNFEIFNGKIGYIKMRLIKKNPFSKLGRNFRLRDNSIKSFCKQKFKLSDKISSFSELTQIIRDYSAVIVGSDQLWLPSNIFADYYTLNWVPKDIKKISYATSFGVSSLPYRYERMTKEFLERFDYISVREKSGKEIVNSLSNKKVEVICDPTLVFNKNEWDKILDICDNSRFIKEKYIFCYFLGDNLEHRKIVKKISSITGYKVVALQNLNVFVKSDCLFADYIPYDINSSDFVNLIKNAEYVFTDSFHASVFSIIYEKKFFTFKRFKDNYSLQTNTRLDTLFDYFNLTERYVLEYNDFEKIFSKQIDYNEINKKINILKKKNIDFLLSSLNENKG